MTQKLAALVLGFAIAIAFGVSGVSAKDAHSDAQFRCRADCNTEWSNCHTRCAEGSAEERDNCDRQCTRDKSQCMTACDRM